MASKQKPYDLIFVFGYGPVQPVHSQPRGKLPVFGRLNALAAGQLFRAGRAHTLVLSGGKTGGNALESEAFLLAQYLQHRFHLPADVCLCQPDPFDTIGNFIYLANLLDKHPAQLRVLYLAMAHHLPRVQELAAIFGLVGDFRSAQEVLVTRSARHRQWLSAVFNIQSTLMQTAQESEARALRGIRNLPRYLLPELPKLVDWQRLKTVLAYPPLQAYCRAQTPDPLMLPEKQLRQWLLRLPREFPI